MGGLLYAIGMTIIGICDTRNGGVEKRAKEQEQRSRRLERNQAMLQAQAAQRQQKLDADMKKRQATL